MEQTGTSRQAVIVLMRRLMRKPSAILGGGIVMALLVTACFAPLIATHDPYEIIVANRLQPPGGAHIFGTDDVGRDLFSRIVWGSRITLQIGVIAVGIATVIGSLLGLVSGYLGGVFDLLFMRIIDVMLAFPGLLLAMAIVAVLGPGLENAMMAVGISSIPGYARTVRSLTLTAKEEVYVEAARALGGGNWRIMFRHILPNALPTLMIYATLTFPGAILSAAALSYVGLGAQPPTPEWGALLVGAREFIRRAPWIVNIPGLVIMITVLGFNLLGNALRDVFDPRLRGS